MEKRNSLLFANSQVIVANDEYDIDHIFRKVVNQYLVT